MDTHTSTPTTESKSKKTWRNYLPVHPAADLLPLMPDNDRRDLADDIKKKGLGEPIALFRDKDLRICVLDGRNRLDALELIGFAVQVKVKAT